MAKLEILTYPDKRLRQIAKPVTEFNDRLHTLSEDMAETMYDAPGIGLAAVQVNVALRLIVMDLSEEKNRLQVLVNPEIIKQEGCVITQEGCLSVPEVYADVERAEKITLRAQDINGEPFEIEADELLAVCVQHEIDHLNGKVFVDYLSRIKQERIRKKLLKEERLAYT
jgi:peptide deformylase